MRRADDLSQAEVNDVMKGLPASPRRGPLYAFSFRNFRLFFYGQLISVAGTWMQTVAQQWFVWELEHSAVWLGIISGASAIPYVLFSMAGGQVADRYPRRTTLIVTQTLAMLLAFALAFMASYPGIHVRAWHVAVLAALSGIVNAYNMPAQQAFVTDMVDDREALGNAIALNSLRFNLARFLGPILAGAVLVKAGAAACFFWNGMSYLAVIASLAMMRLKPFVPHDRRTSIWQGFQYIGHTRSIFRVVLLVATASLFAWSASTLYPVFATHFHQGARGFSRMMAFNGIGAALGGVALATFGERITRRLVVYGGACLFCVALLLFASAPSYTFSLGCLLVSGFFMIVFGISANTKVQEEVPDALRGRVMAVYSLVFQGLMPVGGLEIGFLAEHLNPTGALRINATLCLTITLALYAWSLLERPAAERRLAEIPAD
jgi:MFS family permease